MVAAAKKICRRAMAPDGAREKIFGCNLFSGGALGEIFLVEIASGGAPIGSFLAEMAPGGAPVGSCLLEIASGGPSGGIFPAKIVSGGPPRGSWLAKISSRAALCAVCAAGSCSGGLARKQTPKKDANMARIAPFGHHPILSRAFLAQLPPLDVPFRAK